MVTNLTDKELLEDLRSGPAGRKLLKVREERRLAERRDQAGQIAVLEGEHEKALPGLNAAVEAAADKVKAAQEALEKAQEGRRVAEMARSSAASRFDTQRGQLEAKLTASAAPEIDSFLGEISRDGERVRQRGISSVPARRNWRGAMEGGGSNFESVQACLKGLQEARVKAEALHLRALDREELAAEMDRIRGAIPQVEA